ncbi:MAG: PDZ domain-containing protein [Acidimicrobiia bacterium]|nr:PDZ domain-containing protein [Acidimicrobiia bacterium]MYC57491.1 PDZ domain-containing protein [Acidimicrobiia bacterium]MYG93717.1 PDZ domain-containing protein [Acidimicrobiia bacterium]MYI30021.1 PDZ domain-containing protein [Acidimicrobiia bacterium]
MSIDPEAPRGDWDFWGWGSDEPTDPESSSPSFQHPLETPLPSTDRPESHSSAQRLPEPAKLVEPTSSQAFNRVVVTDWVSHTVSPRIASSSAWAMLWVSVVLAMFGLVGIGVGIGSVFLNRDAPASEVVVISAPEVDSTTPLQVDPSQVSVPTSSQVSNVDTVPVEGVSLLDSVVDVARAVLPSVVLIEVTGVEEQSLDSLDLSDGVPRWGQGSGIIYDASGLILTNAHVVEDAQEVTVQLMDGTRAPGEVVGTASALDVALVKVDTDVVLIPAQFAERSTVEVGQLAVAIGSPYGLHQSVTSGIVSAIGRAVREGSGEGAFVEMIQTDAPINPGNSGGALANQFGQVIGMNTLIRTDGSMGNIGLGFAIPTDIAVNIAERILNGESTELGYLGVWGDDPEMGLPGALVAEVLPGTPAELANLMPGDLIVGIDNESVATFTELAAKIQFRIPGATVVLDVVRDGVTIQILVQVGERSQFADLQPTPQSEDE